MGVSGGLNVHEGSCRALFSVGRQVIECQEWSSTYARSAALGDFHGEPEKHVDFSIAVTADTGPVLAFFGRCNVGAVDQENVRTIGHLSAECVDNRQRFGRNTSMISSNRRCIVMGAVLGPTERAQHENSRSYARRGQWRCVPTPLAGPQRRPVETRSANARNAPAQ